LHGVMLEWRNMVLTASGITIEDWALLQSRDGHRQR
jgi:hypothetical protein